MNLDRLKSEFKMDTNETSTALRCVLPWYYKIFRESQPGPFSRNIDDIACNSENYCPFLFSRFCEKNRHCPFLFVRLWVKNRKCLFWKKKLWKKIFSKKKAPTQSVREWEPDSWLLRKIQHNQCWWWQLRNNWKIWMTPYFGDSRSSNPLACASHFSAVITELLISQHAPCNKLLFLVQKFHFLLIAQELQGISLVFLQKGWDFPKMFGTREGRCAGSSQAMVWAGPTFVWPQWWGVTRNRTNR